MSVGALFEQKYPRPSPEVQELVEKLSTAALVTEVAYNVSAVADINIGQIPLIPVLPDVAGAIPAAAQLIQCDTIFVKLISKTPRLADEFSLLVEYIGHGGALPEAWFGADGWTLEPVKRALVASDVFVTMGRAAGWFGGAQSFTPSNVTLSHAQSPLMGYDLEDREWPCRAKAQIVERMLDVMPLTRLWTRAQMEEFCSDLLVRGERLKDSCHSFLERSEATPKNDVQYGHHLFRNLPVMAGGFAADSLFQHAIRLEFKSTDFTELFLALFFEPGVMKQGVMKSHVSTQDMRGRIQQALSTLGLFLRAFSHKDFAGALLPIIDSFTEDDELWDVFHDAYLWYRLHYMLQCFGTDVARRKKSLHFPDAVYPD